MVEIIDCLLTILNNCSFLVTLFFPDTCYGIPWFLIVQVFLTLWSKFKPIFCKIKASFLFQGGQRSKSSRIRKISKQVALAFVKRTLSRCKQFEDVGRSCFSLADVGRSCFSQPSLQDVILYKPPCETDVKPTDRNCLTIVSKVPKKAKRQGLGILCK